MKEVRIAMWSGPRNISTALMRSFENRKDTSVLDEPFYAFYLSKKNYNHPLKELILDSQSKNWDEIAKYCSEEMPNQSRVWYQKHMAHHILKGCDLNWLRKVKNCILIRHPKSVINSYSKKYKIESIRQLGYQQQLEIFYYLAVNNNIEPIIIDSNDLLKDPKRMITKLCNKLDIKFTKRMLSWPAGKRESDGVWGPYWYENVYKSTQFIVPPKKSINLKKSLLPIYRECLSNYNFLFEKRLKL